jgi:arylsulfatase
VPFIIRWPGVVEPGTVSDHVSAFWDVMPSLLDIAGIEPSTNTDGISFYPTLKGETQKEHKYLYWEFHERGTSQAVRIGKWKGVRRDIRYGNMEIELYDLDNDVSETNNIAIQYPGIVELIDSIMNSEHETSPIERFRNDQLDE